MTGGTFARDLVLPEKDSDVLLVTFLLEVLEERNDSLVPARPGAHEKVFLLLRKLAHGTSIGMRSRPANSASARRLLSYRGLVHGSIAPSRSVRSGFGTITERSYSSTAPNPLHVGHAPRGLLNEKKLGRRSRRARVIVRALEALGEYEPVSTVGGNYDALAIPVGERSSNRIAQPPGDLRRNREAVDDNENLFGSPQIDATTGEIVEVKHFAVDADAKKSLRAEILDHHGVRDEVGEAQRERRRRTWFLRVTREPRRSPTARCRASSRGRRPDSRCARCAPTGAGGSRRSRSPCRRSSARSWWDSAARSRRPATVRRSNRRRASPCARETAARKPKATRRTAAGLRRKWYRRRGTTCLSPRGR